MFCDGEGYDGGGCLDVLAAGIFYASRANFCDSSQKRMNNPDVRTVAGLDN